MSIVNICTKSIFDISAYAIIKQKNYEADACYGKVYEASQRLTRGS